MTLEGKEIIEKMSLKRETKNKKIRTVPLRGRKRGVTKNGKRRRVP